MKKTKRTTQLDLTITAARRARANELRTLQRDGVVLKAATMPDRRKVASKKACRGRIEY